MFDIPASLATKPVLLESGDHPGDFTDQELSPETLEQQIEAGESDAFALFNEDGIVLPWRMGFFRKIDGYGSFPNINGQVIPCGSHGFDLVREFLKEAALKVPFSYAIGFRCERVWHAYEYAVGGGRGRLRGMTMHSCLLVKSQRHEAAKGGICAIACGWCIH